ncbi:MAG: hypothetical protein FIB01_13520 [Gemmatimonadetes bacterium]|nr:hypothetical protein [Gemmatimonadota bacterium]
MRNRLAAVLLLAICACDRPSHAAGPPRELEDATLAATVGTTAIYFHRSLAAVDSLQPRLLAAIRLALDAIGRVVPVSNVRIRVVVLPEAVLPAFGVSGVADSSRIDLFLDPEHPNLRNGIQQALLPTIAHEYHHVLRNRTSAYGNTLYEAMVSEGLAEEFVREVTGRPAPWTGSLPPDVRAHWRREAEAIWCREQYDQGAWFIGTGGTMPRGTGFEIGADIVGEYLATHPGARPSALAGAPARMFLPNALRGDPVADCWRTAEDGGPEAPAATPGPGHTVPS